MLRSLARALGYLLNHEAGLRVFLDDPAVPIDNNESERAGVPSKAYLEAAAEHALRRAGAVLLPDEFKRQLEAASDPPDTPA